MNIRALIAALVFFGACVTSAAARPDDLSGDWGAEATDSRMRNFPDYFRAQLKQDDAGGVSGPGVVNLCAACRGFDEYPVLWRGEIVDGELVMIGEAQGHHGRWRDVTFRGQWFGSAFRGLLTRQGRTRGEFVMERVPESERTGARESH